MECRGSKTPPNLAPLCALLSPPCPCVDALDVRAAPLLQRAATFANEAMHKKLVETKGFKARDLSAGLQQVRSAPTLPDSSKSVHASIAA